MDPTETLTRGGPPPDVGEGAGDPPGDWVGADRALIDRAVAAQVLANRGRAGTWEAIHCFHAARVEEVAAAKRDGQPAFFALTPLESTKAEFGALLGFGSQMIEVDLEMTDDLKRFFPRLWGQCLAGRVDLGRARLVQGPLGQLTNDADRHAYAALVQEYLDKQDDPSAVLHPVTYPNLRQACWRRARKFEQVSRQQTFDEAFAKRRVSLRTDETGIASLSCRTRVDHCAQAEARLTLIAKKRAEADGEDRTIEQLKVDTLIDLLLGRVTCAVTDAELAGDSGAGDGPGPGVGDGGSDSGSGGDARRPADGGDSGHRPGAGVLEWHEVGKFARPVVHVTVPWATLAGASDEPGRMAGGVVIPAELSRLIGEDKRSTLYRMVTDPVGRFVELSTDRYAPTEPLSRSVTARDPECIFPGCRRPATVCEIDHRIRWPLGPTALWCLQPLCELHHKVKHSKGWRVVREDDGSYTWTSRFGTVLRTPPPEYPLVFWGIEDVRLAGSENTSFSSETPSELEGRFAELIAQHVAA